MSEGAGDLDGEASSLRDQHTIHRFSPWWENQEKERKKNNRAAQRRSIILEALLPVLAQAEVVDAADDEATRGDGHGEGNRHGGDLVLLVEKRRRGAGKEFVFEKSAFESQ